MRDVFTVLQEDHQSVKQILLELTGAGACNLKKLAEQLVIDESRHEAAEEMYFWPAVREHVPGGDALADKAIGQESEAKKVLVQIEEHAPRSADFAALITKFNQAAREHISFEENEVWPALRQALSGRDAEELGRDLVKAKESAPTRPHPGTPPSPGVLKTVGAVAATVDHVRDSMTDRG